jgi:hypothetical protein
VKLLVGNLKNKIMDVKTKFNIGDYVFTVMDNKVWNFTINSIFIRVSNEKIIVEYKFVSNERLTRKEHELFTTKEELLKSL